MSHFYCMPAFIAEDPEMPMLHKMIYMFIFSYTNNNKPCFYSNATLAKKVGVKVRQLQYGLAALQRAELVSSLTTKHRRYLVTMQHNLIICDEPDPEPCTTVHPTHAPQCIPPMHHSAPIIDKIINKVIEEEEKSVDTQAATVKTLKKYEIRVPKKINRIQEQYIQKAINLLAEKDLTLDLYLEYLTVKCPRRLLPYISNGVERTNGFGNILRPSFITDTLTGSWED